MSIANKTTWKIHSVLPFAELHLVSCYPNDIHISDVVLRDLTKPVSDLSSIAPRSHKGLHVFQHLLEGLLSVAKQKGVERLSLVAASSSAPRRFRSVRFSAN